MIRRTHVVLGDIQEPNRIQYLRNPTEPSRQ